MITIHTDRFLRNAAFLLVCLLLAALGLTACSSAKTQVNKGPVKARTFSFINVSSRPLPDYAEQRKEAHVLVQQAIIRNLGSKGVSHVASGGDVTVAYLVVVGNNAVTTSLNGYFGYNADSEAFGEKVHSLQTGGNDRGYIEAGTLVIDLVEPATSKVLQRRSVRAPVLRDLQKETRATRVQTIVDAALKDVPVSH